MLKTIEVTIEGLSSLLVNRFHEEAQQSVITGTSSKAERPPPYDDAANRLYSNGHGPFIPNEWIRQSLIGAASRFKTGRRAATTDVAAAVFIFPYELPLEGDWHVDSRAAVIKAAGGARVMRHRPMFDQWRVSFQIQIDTDTGVTEDLMKQVVESAGKLVGIGDYRPARKGQYGRFSIVEWKAKK